MCMVSLPNREISFVYQKEILSKLEDAFSTSATTVIQEDLYCGDYLRLEKDLQMLLMQSASFYDTANESFFHGLMLGLCAIMNDRFYITSNREAGTGRYDIQLMPRVDNLPGIMIELKGCRNEADNLDKRAEEALEQIKGHEYYTEIQQHGVARVIRYGMAFCGKQVKIAMES